MSREIIYFVSSEKYREIDEANAHLNLDHSDKKAESISSGDVLIISPPIAGFPILRRFVSSVSTNIDGAQVITITRLPVAQENPEPLDSLTASDVTAKDKNEASPFPVIIFSVATLLFVIFLLVFRDSVNIFLSSKTTSSNVSFAGGAIALEMSIEKEESRFNDNEFFGNVSADDGDFELDVDDLLYDHEKAKNKPDGSAKTCPWDVIENIYAIKLTPVDDKLANIKISFNEDLMRISPKPDLVECARVIATFAVDEAKFRSTVYQSYQ